jgi:flap endonuclease-1
LKREQTTLKALHGKSFAVDASIELHQFLALIRRPDGTLFTDKSGRVTSHLIGLLNRTSRLITEYGMRPFFVFDGKPHPLKKGTLEARRTAREKAQTEYVQALARRDFSGAWSKAVMTGRVTRDVLADAKRLLSLMGVPWLEAPEDAEAQASFMAAKGRVWAVSSKDYDSLLYGAPILARYLTITGREFLPAQRRMRPLIPELVKLSDNLNKLGITRVQLIDVAILVGTDFNEGVQGIGPKKALGLIRKYGMVENLPEQFRPGLPMGPDEVREIFLHPKVLEFFELTPPPPNPDGLVSFLSGERGFSEERVRRVAERLVKAYGQRDIGLSEWLR